MLKRMFNLDMGGGGSSTPSESSSSQPGDSGASSSTPAPSSSSDSASSSDAPSYGFDSFESFSATPWLSELPEDRRGYLTDGLKGLYDKHREASEGWTSREAELNSQLESRQRDADTYRGFLEVAHPEFKDLNDQIASLKDKSTKFDEAAAELEKVRAEHATGQATVAELRKAIEERNAASSELQKAHDAMKVELANEKIAGDTLRREKDAMQSNYYGVLEDQALAALYHVFPGASDVDLAKALDAFNEAIVAPTPDAEGKVKEGWRREAFINAFKAAASVMPKPDKIPSSVTAMNHERSSSNTGPTDATLKREFYATPGEGMAVARQLAAKHGIPVSRVMEAISAR